MTDGVISIVIQKLKLQWSPVQIAGYLKKHNITHVSHETIYKYIWKDKKQGGLLHQDLRH